MDKCLLLSGQIHLAIFTDTYSTLKFVKQTFNKWTPEFYAMTVQSQVGQLECLKKQSGQMHFKIWTNTFCKRNRYILQIGKIHFETVIYVIMQ